MQVTPNISLHRLLKYEVAEVVAGRAGHAGLGLVGFEFLPHLNRRDQVFIDRVRAYSEAVPHDIVGVDDGGAISVTANGEVAEISDDIVTFPETREMFRVRGEADGHVAVDHDDQTIVGSAAMQVRMVSLARACLWRVRRALRVVVRRRGASP